MIKQLTPAIILACTAALSALIAQPAQAMTIASDRPLSEFSDQNLDHWSERSFDGNTHYELVEDDGFRVLKAHTRNQASILYREKTIDLDKTPVITWDWKIDRTYMNIDERVRGGDDFPARLYVAAQVGFLPWETVAINYVWASGLPIGEIWSNPFTDKAKMIAVQSGQTYVGQWTRHSRNVLRDFKTLFDRDIEEITGYAVMVDGDNAQKEATAWFGDIVFSAQGDSESP